MMENIRWQGETVSRLILGTAQFGMDYGIANTRGKPAADSARAIVETAWKAGIRHLDTAQAYGDSEAILGRALRELGIADHACITSKLALPEQGFSPTDVRDSVAGSVQRLGVERLWCFMLHHPRQLAYWDRGLGEALLGLREEGHIRYLGVSLSPLGDAPRCIAHPDMDVLQLPCNAWDRRPIETGVLDTARGNGKLCCVRSLYLQGLLTLSPSEAVARLPKAEEVARRWHAFAESQSISVAELAIRFGMNLETPLVVGADSSEQLEKTLAWMRQGPLAASVLEALAEALGSAVDDEILEPWRWPVIER